MPNTADQFDFSQYDYVVDAIDMVSSKLDLIVDANMSTLVNAETVTLKMGTYHYDYSIGQYGGYRIPLN